jgi:hypothetical protein
VQQGNVVLFVFWCYVLEMGIDWKCVGPEHGCLRLFIPLKKCACHLKSVATEFLFLSRAQIHNHINLRECWHLNWNIVSCYPWKQV